MAFSSFVMPLYTLFAFFILHPLISIAQQQQQPAYRYHFCTGRNFTANSLFPENRNKTLSSLIANAAASQNFGFFNTSTGQGVERANGIFLCRGDISTELCELAVKLASEDIVERCPTQMTAIIWYDECTVRYSNQSVFSKRQEFPKGYLISGTNITYSLNQLNQAVGKLMNDLVKRASVKSRNMFAVGETMATPFDKIYGMAQCTPDLSSYDCTLCLENAVSDLPNCCESQRGARVVKPSCFVRYESGLFYYTTVTPSPSPPRNPVVVSPPEPEQTSTREGGVSRKTIVAIVVPIVAIVVLLSAVFLCLTVRRKYSTLVEETSDEKDIETVQSLQFDLATVEVATNNFSHDNKIGQGGFGVVYKGILPNGEEIAVKRLSSHSGQGAQEFKNEVIVVAKLQHRNLVRLLGFCLEKGEKILIFEFVKNRSLDYFLFDSEKKSQLDWSIRYKIIGGIARGILYLHEDSRLKIIHRDLKAGNILLDEDLNAKISDFGMAKIFGVDQTRGNTSRIAGTFGYISPEYGMHGQFSVKSDVYSFGVLILEIISGKKNTNFYQSNLGGDLISYAWRLWRDGTPLEFMDPILSASYTRNEVIRCIHIGLLCVQDDADDRPNMTTIVLMLSSYSVSLPLPKPPALYGQSRSNIEMPLEEAEPNQSTNKSTADSVNETSITELYPR